jgi:hypothetical protein
MNNILCLVRGATSSIRSEAGKDSDGEVAAALTPLSYSALSYSHDLLSPHLLLVALRSASQKQEEAMIRRRRRRGTIGSVSGGKEQSRVVLFKVPLPTVTHDWLRSSCQSDVH